jgi:small conductance mechanosensitive channel
MEVICQEADMDTTALAAQTSLLVEMLMRYLPPIMGAVAVLVIGSYAARSLQRMTASGLGRSKVDATLQPVLASIVRYAILGITFMVVLQQFGVQTATLLAVLGTMGLAIGLALQGTLSNVAAGFLLLFLRPFEVGHQIGAGGSEGTVQSIDLFHTNIRTDDGIDVSIPNSSILAGSIRNITSFPERVIALTITVAHDADTDKAIAIITDVLKNQPHILKNRAYGATIKTLGAQLDLAVSGWVRNEHFAKSRAALLQAIKHRFAAEGVAFPGSPQPAI